MATNGPISGPNSSSAIRVVAIGVFATPVNTATKPMPAILAKGMCSNGASALPSVAPM